MPLEGFGRGGLISDLRKESLSLQFFDECLNLKSKHGSIKALPAFEIDAGGKLRLYSNTGDGAGYTNETSIKPAEITQWTRGGEIYNHVLTAGFDSGGVGKIYLTGGPVVAPETKSIVTELTSDYSFSYGSTQKIDAFVFNEMAVLNLPSAPPQFSTDKLGFSRVPNWLCEAYGATITSIVEGNQYEVQVATLADWSAVGGPSAVVVGTKFDATATGSVVGYGSVKNAAPYHAERVVPYNGRLVAMNLYNDLGDGAGANDVSSSISLAYSSSIVALNSLSGVQWYAASTNSAGSVLLTETPGRIVDASQLGDYLMVYKTDSVYRFFDTGSPFYLTGEAVFMEDGVLSERCVVDMGGNKHLVVGNYSIYMHTGGPEMVSLSDQKVEDDFYDDLPTSLEDRALTFAFHDTLNSEIWICYRDISQDTNAADKGCTIALIFDYVEGTFHKRSLPNVNDIIQTEVDGKPQIIAASLDTVAGSSSAGSLYILNGTYESGGFMRWNARELGAVDTLKELNGLYPTSENSFYIKVYSDNVPTVHDMSTETAYLFDPTADYKEDFREAGRYYTIEISMNGVISPEISAMKADMEQGSNR
jgi:hypothetical protein